MKFNCFLLTNAIGELYYYKKASRGYMKSRNLVVLSFCKKCKNRAIIKTFVLSNHHKITLS